MAELSTSGAGIVDSVAETVKAIQGFDSPADVLDVGLTTASVGLDALAFMANPVDALASSVIAWMIDNLTFLRWPLDLTTGDPAVISNAIKQANDAAAHLDQLADEQANALRTQVPTYVQGQSGSAVPFQDVMELREKQLRGASMACVGVAESFSVAGAWVGTVRAVARDLIADFVWELIQKATRMFAAGPLTFGFSVAEFVASALQRAAILINRIGDMFATMLNKLNVLNKQMRDLAEELDSLFGATGALKPFYESTKEAAKADDASRSTSQESDRVTGPHARAGGVPTDNPEWWTKKGYL